MVVVLTDTNQNVVAQYAYDPFGNPLSESGVAAGLNLMRFSSKEWHPQSRTYYYGGRYYDPNLQRWLNHDPSGLAGGINLYQFVENNPMELVDPDGFQPFNVAVTPRITPRPGPGHGEITEEILNGARANRT